LITDVQEYTAAMENADEMAEGTLHHHPDTHGEIGAIPYYYEEGTEFLPRAAKPLAGEFGNASVPNGC